MRAESVVVGVVMMAGFATTIFQTATEEIRSRSSSSRQKVLIDHIL